MDIDVLSRDEVKDLVNHEMNRIFEQIQADIQLEHSDAPQDITGLINRLVELTW